MSKKCRSEWRVAVLPGDGIGPEVTTAALRALECLGPPDGPILKITIFPWPSHAWHEEHGRMAPEDWLETLASYDAILLGALGDPGPIEEPCRYLLPDRVSLAPLLEMRRHFKLWACERPAKHLRGAPQYLADARAKEIDLYVIRENSEGEYCGQGGRLRVGGTEEIAIQVGVFTRTVTERLLRYAFRQARQRAKDRQADVRRQRDFRGKCSQVCLVTKRNALPFSGGLYIDVFEGITKEFPDVDTHHELVDAACMKFVTTPWKFDVVVASNLHGDILTDLAAVLCGGMGLAPSANTNPYDRFCPPLFEPTHGSAPDIAGKGIASPHAMLLTTEMMLNWMGAEDARAAAAARRLRDAVIRNLILSSGKLRSTKEITYAVCAALS